MGDVTLILEGRIAGPWVGELERAARFALSGGGLLRLDLAGVEFIDRGGIALCRQLAGAQVEVSNCPGFISEILRGTPS